MDEDQIPIILKNDTMGVDGFITQDFGPRSGDRPRYTLDTLVVGK